MPMQQQELAQEIDTLAEAADAVDDLMSTIVGRLQERLSHFHWVGFYMVEKGLPGEEPMLVLGPYVGAETPHKRIPLNQGICGAAVTHGETVVVDDVNSDPRYLACSIETKSEIVVPIFVSDAVVGELDIDSHLPAAFGPDDRRLVERLPASLAASWRDQQAKLKAHRAARSAAAPQTARKQVVAGVCAGRRDSVLPAHGAPGTATQMGVLRRQDGGRRNAATGAAP